MACIFLPEMATALGSSLVWATYMKTQTWSVVRQTEKTRYLPSQGRFVWTVSKGTTDTNRGAHLQHKLQMDAKTRSPREWCCPGETIQSTEGPDCLPQEVREEGEKPSYQSLCAFMEYLRGPLTATHGMQIRHFVYLTGTAKVRRSCSATCSPRSAEDLTQEIHGQVILSFGQVDIYALTLSILDNDYSR